MLLVEPLLLSSDRIALALGGNLTHLWLGDALWLEHDLGWI
jgi:hypothetical protein